MLVLEYVYSSCDQHTAHCTQHRLLLMRHTAHCTLLYTAHGTQHTAHSTQHITQAIFTPGKALFSLFTLSSSLRTAVTFACDPHDHQREEEKADEDTCDTCDDTHGGRSGVNRLFIGCL